MNFSNSKSYMEKYSNLTNGYYEYTIDSTVVNLYTRFEDNSGWIRVITVDWNRSEHLTANSIPDIKLHDYQINLLRSQLFEYNVLAEADAFKSPFNDWLRYPHTVYIHNTMTEFNSTALANTIPNSNAVSLKDSGRPIVIKQDDQSIGFGSGNLGDTFFSLGCEDRKGFFQSFSGAGRGSVFVR
jgi:hypothetical protein